MTYLHTFCWQSTTTEDIWDIRETSAWRTDILLDKLPNIFRESVQTSIYMYIVTIINKMQLTARIEERMRELEDQLSYIEKHIVRFRRAQNKYNFWQRSNHYGSRRFSHWNSTKSITANNLKIRSKEVIWWRNRIEWRQER